FDGLSGFIVGYADTGGFAHVGVGRYDVFDFRRVHLEPGYDDSVILAIDNEKPAGGIAIADITTAQQAVGSKWLGIGAVPVALHHLWPADAQFAGLAG